MPTLTVFTPTYNRAHTLCRTFKSLCNQKCKDFIWLIIDDGSSDNTAVLVQEWKKLDNGFEIKYLYKDNGGMHTAHNVAYDNIETELNVCIDSDDCLAENAIEKIIEKWQDVKSLGYAGIIGLDADLNTGHIIGNGFSEQTHATTLREYYNSGGKGDKKLVYRTDIMKKIPPYPVFEGEKYVALAYKYRLVDLQYKLAILNEILCLVEYQPDGSSNSMFKQYLNNPRGFAFWRKVCMETPDSFRRLFIDCIHYVSSSIIAKNKNFVIESPRKFLTILALPFGFIFSLLIKYKAKNK